VPNATRDYLDHHARRTADTITGRIIERQSNGVYVYEDIASGASRYATPNTNDEYAIGSRVRIDRVSAGRNVIGAQDVITGRAPKEERGLSGTTPSVDRNEVGRAFITSVDPDPLILTAGGASGEQVITGGGFTSAAEYFARGEADDPTVTDADEPEVTPTQVVMTISADAASALGEFGVTVNGAVASNAIRIVASRRVTALWYWRADGSELLSVNKATGAIIGTWANPGGVPDYRPLLADATYVYAFTTTHLLRIGIVSGVSETFVLAEEPNFLNCAAVVAGVLYYGEADAVYPDTRPRRLIRFDPSDSSTTYVLLGSADSGYRYVVSAIGADIFGVITDVQVAPNVAVPFALNTVTESATFAGVAAEVLADPVGVTATDIVFVGGAVAGYSAYRYDRPSLDFEASAALAIDAWYGSFANPHLLVTENDEPGATLHLVNAETFAVQSAALPAITQAGGVAANAEVAYVVSENEDVVQIVNRSTLAVTSITAPAAVGVVMLA